MLIGKTRKKRGGREEVVEQSKEMEGDEDWEGEEEREGKDMEAKGEVD